MNDQNEGTNAGNPVQQVNAGADVDTGTRSSLAASNASQHLHRREHDPRAEHDLDLRPRLEA